MLGRILDALAPRACVACRRGAWPFCPGCARALTPLQAPWCDRCGTPGMGSARCRSCPPGPVSRIRSAFVFDGPARDAILRLKFGGDRGVALALGRAAAVVAPEGAAGVTWVPLSARRKAKRGFDQAEMLARSVSRELDLPLVRSLRRTVDLPPQARRAAAERRTALAGAFEARSASEGCLLLVDDVFTTGATVAECARVLIEAGAGVIDVVTVARTPLLSSDGLRTGSVVARGIIPR